ncbi:TylF/MycF family methyltransferase [Candidatus Pelagibacter sp.]|nr:TylF/MycF family methyltransferase [Candidatus Pelagibacter sp.]
MLKKIINLFGYKVIKKKSWLNKVENLIVEATQEELRLFDKLESISLTSIPNKWSLLQSLKYIHHNKVEGDIVETGVYKGANLIIINNFINEHYLNKKIFAYDTYEGQSSPTAIDEDITGKSMIKKFSEYKKNDQVPVYCSIDKVKENILKLNKFDLSKIFFIKGKVEETLKIQNNLPSKISLLRLDTDFHDSIHVSLEILYPKLVSGGVLIIDDYGHFKGAKVAVDNYFKNKKDIWMHRVDYTCRLIIKP